MSKTRTLETYTPVNKAGDSMTGIIAMPYQPAFYVGKSNGNWTGQCIFNDVQINIGSCYNSTTGRFTAPVSGRYFVSMDTICHDNNSAGYKYFALNKNGATVLTPYSYVNTNNHHQFNFAAVVDLAVNDYLTINGITGEFYGQSSQHTHFSGHLIG
ncbi:hypothetical protein [Flavobacterium sp.]|jgi:hypothetical protein|uniref:C1q-like domain-containing protein n=1 Tax=Flavobacterium sp. TaxID=239 RepID=UPI0037C0BFAE